MISVEVIPHADQRYDTVGDWAFEADGTISINVSQVKNRDYESLIAIHEIIESILCRHAGITAAQVDEWDMSHKDSNDPGSLSGCPYYMQHVHATIFEKHLAGLLNVKWGDYCECVDALSTPEVQP
jgi:hypothetical protein